MRKRFAAIVACALALSACAHKQYEICDTPNCGDNVTIELDK